MTRWHNDAITQSSYSLRMRKLLTLAAATLLVSIAAAQINPIDIIIRLIFRRGTQQQRVTVTRTVHPDQIAEIPNLAAIRATQKCENWSWAAAVETSLRAQGVKLPQNYWVMKASARSCMSIMCAR